MSTKLTVNQTLEFLPHVKSVAFVYLNQTMYALDVGGLMFVGERPAWAGTCYVSPISYYLFDEDEFEEELHRMKP